MADSLVTRRRDWILANPWPFVCFGLFAAATACLLGGFSVAGAWADGLRGFLMVLGLACGGIAVALRLNSRRPAYLDLLPSGWRLWILPTVALILGGVAGGLTLLLVTSVQQSTWHEFGTGQTFVVWFLVAPMSAFGAWGCVKRTTASRFTWGEEAALILLLAGLTCLLAGWSLPRGSSGKSWATMAMFLGAVSFVAFAAAPLFVVPDFFRKFMLGSLFLVHLGGICTAALASPPTPWFLGQVWMRIYRPYLEFMYLNNAYHFYAPEPGPASYIWFRLLYEDPQGDLHGVWRKIPEVDEDGRPGHGLRLNYQRFLAATENAVQPDTNVAAATTFDAEGKSAWQRRLEHSPEILKQPVVLGKPPVIPDLLIPFHPMVAAQQQYQPPNFNSVVLLRSYALHVARNTKHPEHPEWPCKLIKVYRVAHIIPPDSPFNDFNPYLAGTSIWDPESYRASYVGTYDLDGNLTDRKDPFLYWLLPAVRETPQDPNSPIRDYARLHAGDPKWISVAVPSEPGRRRWVEAEAAPAPKEPKK